MKISAEGNWSCEVLNRGESDQNPKINKQEPSLPEPLPPGTKKETPVVLSEQALQNRKAFIGHFIQSLKLFGTASGSFGLSVAVAVLTGGVGAPLAAVTGVAVIVAAGDACCALYNLVQVYHDRSTLRTGSNCILLAVKTLMMKCGLGESKAESVGDATSFALRAGLAVTMAKLSWK